MKTNKDKILKSIFIVSFLPYILILIYGFYGAIFGGHRICIVICPPKVYGIEAFLDNIFAGSLALTFYGVLPVVIIYEIGYIIYILISKRKKSN